MQQPNGKFYHFFHIFITFLAQKSGAFRIFKHMFENICLLIRKHRFLYRLFLFFLL